MRPAIANGDDAYGWPFWLTYASNFLSAAGIGVLVRYGDFITFLGGTEFHLGWIVGIGTVGSLMMRLAMGTGIDRQGPRLIWLGSILLFAATCFAHLAIGSPTGVAIYLLRIAYCCAMSGIYGASITFVANRVPAARMAEVVGIVGTAGFLASIVGAQIGDLLRGSGELRRSQLDLMFVAAGLLGLAALPVAGLALRGYAHPPQGPRGPVFTLLRRYHPGAVLLVVVAMGVALNLPYTFLPTYAAELHIERIALFFTVYSLAAVVTRVLTRQWPQRLGLRAMMLLGIVGMAVSQLLFLLVRSEWDLWLPGLAYGMAHAVLFPATVALGNRWFPEQHRGLGTTLVLAAWDVGLLLGMPSAGALLHYSEAAGLAPYPTMFLCVAGLVAVAGAWYMIGSRAEPKYRLGRLLKFNAQKEQFVGNAEAEKLLTRECRAPYVVPKEVRGQREETQPM